MRIVVHGQLEGFFMPPHRRVNGGLGGSPGVAWPGHPLGVRQLDEMAGDAAKRTVVCLLYTSPSPRD